MPSYSPVFSQGFIYYTDATPNSQFEVPSGFTAVIRDATLWVELGAAVVQVYIQLDEEAPGVTVIQLSGVGEPSYDSWQGRIMVPAGGIITYYVSDVDLNTHGYVGGYLLRNTLT